MSRRWIGFKLCLSVFMVVLAAKAAVAQTPACRQHNPDRLRAHIRNLGGQIDASLAGDAMVMEVPATVQVDIGVLKNRLVDAVDAVLTCESPSQPDVRLLQEGLTAALGTSGRGKRTGENAFATRTVVSVREVSGSPPWLLVRLHLLLPGWDDNVLLVYVHQGAGWRRTLRWQSADYAKINRASGDFFDYMVLPSGDDHGRRIVVAHGNPWPTSRYSGFTMDVIAPGQDPNSARQMFTMSSPYSRGDMLPELIPVAGGFEIRLQVCTLTNPNMCRTGIFRYCEQKYGYVRVQPVALDPLDFLGAWLDVRWPQAARWSNPGTLRMLRSAHIEVHGGIQGGAFASMQFSYGAVHECAGKRYQVALLFQALHADRTTRFFLVRDDGNRRFTMLASSTKPDPACRRKVAMQSR